MKCRLLTDHQGKILGIYKPTVAPKEEADPPQVVIEPLPGQYIHEVSLPSELAKKPIGQIAAEYEIDIVPRNPPLVRRGGSGSSSRTRKTKKKRAAK
jgi:hypothetical protein